MHVLKTHFGFCSFLQWFHSKKPEVMRHPLVKAFLLVSISASAVYLGVAFADTNSNPTRTDTKKTGFGLKNMTHFQNGSGSG